MIPISGKTALLCILADPIGHVRTPQLVNALLQDRDEDAVMVPVHVAPDRLPEVMQALRHTRNLQGMVVTVPHKMAALALCDEVEAEAQAIGAVNVVRRTEDGRLVGGMLDGVGFLRGLAPHYTITADSTVYMAGAGGAAHAIAFALAQAGVRRLTVSNRSAARIDALAQRVKASYPHTAILAGTDDPSAHDVVINATSLGLAPGDARPLDFERLQSTQVVADIIMDPAETPLLAHARARGCVVYGGMGMLQGQVRDMVAFFQADRTGAHGTPDGRVA